ncbi:unnamed protein product [Toxocara canis]|uniref:Eukaryotic translation initiation factor 3 subunit p66 n=1 Tax=Toxocara canis TaxID=6265 RepID=A0A183VC68_TOXCA|nr:unnamed protein product [Toxocara canis]
MLGPNGETQTLTIKALNDYVSRSHTRNTTNHVILGTQQSKPTEFASSIALNLDNAWGIVRCIVDLCMKQPAGKYLLLKEPNKVAIFIRFRLI